MMTRSPLNAPGSSERSGSRNVGRSSEPPPPQATRTDVTRSSRIRFTLVGRVWSPERSGMLGAVPRAAIIALLLLLTACDEEAADPAGTPSPTPQSTVDASEPETTEAPVEPE